MTTSRIDQLKAKHADELAKAEREDAIYLALPKTDTAPNVMLHSGNVVWVTYKAKDLRDALAILGNFNPEPFLMLRGTFLHIAPREWIKERDYESAKEEMECGPAYLEIDGGKGFGPTAKLCQFTRINGQMVKIRCELESRYFAGCKYPAQWYVRSEVAYDKHGNVTSAKHTPPTICGDLPVIKYAGGTPDAYHYVWLWCEGGTWNNEMARFVEQQAA